MTRALVLFLSACAADSDPAGVPRAVGDPAFTLAPTELPPVGAGAFLYVHDGAIWSWDLSGDAHQPVLAIDEVTSLALSPDGTRLAVSVGGAIDLHPGPFRLTPPMGATDLVWAGDTIWFSDGERPWRLAADGTGLTSLDLPCVAPSPSQFGGWLAVDCDGLTLEPGGARPFDAAGGAGGTAVWVGDRLLLARLAGGGLAVHDLELGFVDPLPLPACDAFTLSPGGEDLVLATTEGLVHAHRVDRDFTLRPLGPGTLPKFAR